MTQKNRFKIIGYNVDTQRGFMETQESTGYQGKLALLNDELKPIGAMQIAPALAQIKAYLRQNRIPELGSVDWHNLDSKEFSETPDFQSTFPTHCVRNTYDAQNIDATTPINPLNIDWDKQYELPNLIEKIKNHNGEIIFRKDNFNVFQDKATETQGIGNPYAKQIIQELGIKKAIVYGVATDVCDDFAINGFHNLGIEVYAIEDAMAGVTPKSHKDTVTRWKLEGVNVLRLEDVLRGNLR